MRRRDSFGFGSRITLTLLSLATPAFAIEQVDLNSLSVEQIRNFDFTHKDFSITQMPLKHKGIFSGKDLYGSILKGIDLKDSGIKEAKKIIWVDFTGSTNAPPEMVAGKILTGTKLNGLDLTTIGIAKALDLRMADFAGSFNAPVGMAVGRDLEGAKLHGLDLTRIKANEATELPGVDFTGSFNAPVGMAVGKNLQGAKLHGLDLTRIEIKEASELRNTDFTGSFNAPVGMAINKHLSGSKLYGLDLNHIGISGAKSLHSVDFTGSTNAPMGMAIGRNLQRARLHGLDLSRIGINEATNLQEVDFTGSTDAPVGMAVGKNLRGARLHGLDLSRIGINEATNLQEVDFTGSSNAPAGMASGKDLQDAKIGEIDLVRIGLHEAANCDGLTLTGPVTVNEPFIFPNYSTWGVSDDLIGKPFINYIGKLLTLEEFQQEQDHLVKKRSTVLIINPTADHNSVFSGGDQVFSHSLKGNGYQVKETNSLNSAFDFVQSLPDKTIGHAVVRGHGEPTKLQVGETEEDQLSIENEQNTEKAMLFFEALGRKIRVEKGFQPTVLLHSCSVGSMDQKNECIGHFAATLIPGAKVYAPNKDVAQFELEVNHISDKTIIYNDRPPSTPENPNKRKRPAPIVSVYYNPIRIEPEHLNKPVIPPKELPSLPTGEMLHTQYNKAMSEIKPRVPEPTYSEIENIEKNIRSPTKKQSAKQHLIPLLEHYSKQESPRSHCRELVKSCPAGICDVGQLENLGRELNQIVRFHNIINEVRAALLDYKNHIILHETLTAEFLRELCREAQCKDLPWHLAKYRTGNQVHYLRVIKHILGTRAGFTPVKDLDDVDKEIMESLFLNDKNKETLAEHFMHHYQKYLMDFYETQIEKWLSSDHTKLAEIMESIRTSDQTEGTFCVSHTHYLVNNFDKPTRITRAGVYCLLLASELLGRD